MRYLIFLAVFFSAIFFCSCLGYSTVNESTKEEPKVSKEDKVKKSISDHIVKVFTEQGAYKNYLFGELFVLKPKEILELDELIERKNKLPLKAEEYGNKYDSVMEAQEVKIAFKKQEIKDNKIYPWYEISHLFAIVPLKKEDSVSIYELDFEVYPNYTIKDVHKKMDLKLSNDEYIVFKEFMNQDALYQSNNYSYDYDMNNAFYSKSLAAIEAEEDYKGELIKTILEMMVYIKKNNKFDENDFTLAKVKKVESKFINDDFKIIDYGKLTPVLSQVEDVEVVTGYEINVNSIKVLSQVEDVDVVTGYEINVNSENKEDESKYIFKFQFDLNFVLISVSKELKQ